MHLNKQALARLDARTQARARRAEALPERVLQIGEGNFLRGFADWLFDRWNEAGAFCGRAVVVAPRPSGAKNIEKFNRQDNLYTVWLRGLGGDGGVADAPRLITAVSRALHPEAEWPDVLACADQPELCVVVSNTTEAGLIYAEEPRGLHEYPHTFPGKLTALLYRRYRTFAGDSRAGWVILPCELVADNGALLRDIVLRHAEDWGLPPGFREWVESANVFCNTLVDRIVSGFPGAADLPRMMDRLGYEDELLTVGEPYYAWIIEAEEAIAKRIGFPTADPGVRFVRDASPFRLRKVRLLNGAHTALAALAWLGDAPTVRSAVEDKVYGAFVRCLLDGELVRALLAERPDIARELGEPLPNYTQAVWQRFANPFLEHRIADLLVNAAAKFRERLVPAIQAYIDTTAEVPPCLALATAGFLLYYRPDFGPPRQWRDDSPAAAIIQAAWRSAMTPDAPGGQEERTKHVIRQLLAQPELWGADLALVNAFADRVCHFAVRLVLGASVRRCIAEVCEPAGP